MGTAETPEAAGLVLFWLVPAGEAPGLVMLATSPAAT